MIQCDICKRWIRSKDQHHSIEIRHLVHRPNGDIVISSTSLDTICESCFKKVKVDVRTK